MDDMEIMIFGNLDAVLISKNGYFYDSQASTWSNHQDNIDFKHSRHAKTIRSTKPEFLWRYTWRHSSMQERVETPQPTRWRSWAMDNGRPTVPLAVNRWTSMAILITNLKGSFDLKRVHFPFPTYFLRHLFSTWDHICDITVMAWPCCNIGAVHICYVQ